MKSSRKTNRNSNPPPAPQAVDLRSFENAFLLQSPFFALLAVLIPISILASLFPLLILLLQRFLGTLFFPVGLWFGFALLSAAAASVYWALVKKSMADHGAANIRGAALVAILSYSLGSLFNFDPHLGLKFYPSLFNIPTALISLTVWFPVLNIKRIFSAQELFESHIRSFEGEKLRQIFLEDSSLMAEADGNLRKLSMYYGFFFLPSLALLVICGALAIPLNLPLIILLFLLFTFGALLICFLSFLRREYAYAAEGLTLSGRSKALAAAVLVVLASVGAGLLFSSDKSLFPPGLILELLRLLLELLGRLFRPAETPPPLPEPQLSRPALQGLPPELLELMEESGPSPFWGWLKYAALAAALIFFLWFMIHPLLGRSRFFLSLLSLPGKIRSFLCSWLKTLIQALALFVKSLREGSRGTLSSPTEAALRRLEENLLQGYSPAKRRDLRRSISLFARLIYWGAEVLKVSWKPSYAPAEYCSILSAAAGDIHTAVQADIIRAGELFEKALYAPGPLSRNEREEFKESVEMITAQRGK